MDRLEYILGFCLFIVCISAYQDYEANKFINAVNEENSNDYRKPRHQTAATGSLIFAAVLLVIALIIIIVNRYSK